MAAPELGVTLPLAKVSLELRCGGRRIASAREQLFEGGTTTRLPWSMFRDGQRGTHAARLLTIDAEDQDKRIVRGVAFVDDLAALTSEPMHRGAWRAALTLLSAETLPEYSDIAALFQLVEDVVASEDETEVEDVSSSEIGVSSPAGSTDVVTRDKAPVWPPKSIEADMASHSLGGGSGDLYWFNRILASLVQRPANVHDGTDTTAPTEEHEHEAAMPETPHPRIVSACKRMWNRAYDGIRKLENRLFHLEPAKWNAKKIWGPSTFMFLSALGIKNSSGRTVADEVDTPTATSLAHNFLWMLFGDRDQGDDYSPPATSRYADAVFPPLASDLQRTYAIHPHFEVSAIILTVFAHAYAMHGKSESHPFSLQHWLLFLDAAGDSIDEACRDQGHLQHIWQRYLDDGRDGLDWSEIWDGIQRIRQLDWSDHPGIRSLTSALSHLSSDKYEVVDDYSGVCMNSRCSASGMVDPQNARVLRELRPAVCKACGHLVIPGRLFEAFERMRDAPAT